jgi:LysR family positive regulator for ilvC
VDSLDYRLFLQLCQTLHFARAAKAVAMSASALTRRVQAIEAEVGYPLLIREHREIRLTDAGRQFRSFAEAHVERWEALQGELREETTSPRGSLHLACTVTAAHTILPRLLATFRARYPQITIGLVTQDAPRSLAQLELGEVDLAVIPTDDHESDDLMRTILGRTELAFIGPQDLGPFRPPLSARPPRLNELALVAPISGLERKRLNEWLKLRSVEPQIVAEVRGNEGIIAMVSLGAGIGLVPRLVLEASPLRESVQELPQLKPPKGYVVSLCTRKANLKRRNVQLFWELAQAGV